MSSTPLARRLAWPRIKRTARRAGSDSEPRWVYLLSSPDGRDHATVPAARVPWPQGCDQCARVILPTAPLLGVRSFSVQRGRTPTTLYICGQCVGDLCEASRLPEPEPGS